MCVRGRKNDQGGEDPNFLMMAATETCEKEKLLFYIVTVTQRPNCVKPLSAQASQGKLTKSAFHAFVLLLIMNSVITWSK